MYLIQKVLARVGGKVSVPDTEGLGQGGREGVLLCLGGGTCLLTGLGPGILPDDKMPVTQDGPIKTQPREAKLVLI